MADKSELVKLLTEYGQEHLLKFWDKLSEEEKKIFSTELTKVDFGKMKRLYEIATQDLNTTQVKKDDYIESLPPDVVVKKCSATKEQEKEWWDIGLKEISEGTVAVLLLAGGQGTRLGSNYPKGMYNVGLPSQKTLYQLQAERICRLEQLAEETYGKKAAIRWYIMISDATLKATKDYFEEHSFFGLDPSTVVFFEQHQLPCLTLEGKLMLASHGSIAKAPDGNGGLYDALHSSGVLQDMETQGISRVYVYCVDNILVKVADPSFIGVCVQKGVEAANKVIVKVDPKESVGIVCKVQGKYQVVEYSEISEETAEKRNSDGSLMYKDSNICIHYFTLDFLKKIISDHLDDLPHHIAKKKIPYIDTNGNLIEPTLPNGMKLEKFVFDVFQFSSNFAVFEAERDEEFSPLKNGPSNPKNSPVSCREDITLLHRRYLKEAGVKFTGESNDNIKSPPMCEISPLLSYAGEGLEHLNGKDFDVAQQIHLEPKPINGQQCKKAKCE